MLEKIIQRGKAKLEAQRKAEEHGQSERVIALRKLFNRLIPKSAHKYATIKDYTAVSANFVIGLPNAPYHVERYVTWVNGTWRAVDDGETTNWCVMDSSDPDGKFIDAFDSLDMALARSLEK